MSKKDTPVKIDYRDSGTGKFVTPQYVKIHPKTTEREVRPIHIPKRK